MYKARAQKRIDACGLERVAPEADTPCAIGPSTTLYWPNVQRRGEATGDGDAAGTNEAAGDSDGAGEGKAPGDATPASVMAIPR
jgi:hypothetical protein